MDRKVCSIFQSAPCQFWNSTHHPATVQPFLFKYVVPLAKQEVSAMPFALVGVQKTSLSFLYARLVNAESEVNAGAPSCMQQRWEAFHPSACFSFFLRLKEIRLGPKKPPFHRHKKQKSSKKACSESKLAGIPLLLCYLLLLQKMNKTVEVKHKVKTGRSRHFKKLAW